MTEQNFTYLDVERSLMTMKASMSPEEVHGLMAGWLCVNSEEGNAWQSALFPDLNIEEGLSGLFAETSLQLRGEDFGFELLLPGDDESLVKRGKALTDWCQGFLSGLGLTGFNFNSVEELKEPLQDLAEIAKLDYKNLDEQSEEDLAAFEEVVEYVRVSVMLVFTEVFVKKHRGSDGATDKNKTVH